MNNCTTPNKTGSIGMYTFFQLLTHSSAKGSFIRWRKRSRENGSKIISFGSECSDWLVVERSKLIECLKTLKACFCGDDAASDGCGVG